MLREHLVRCGCNSCPQCFRRKKRLRHESLLRHFESVRNHCGELHCAVLSLAKKQWDTIRRGIVRRDGDFNRYRWLDDLFYIVSTIPFAGSSPLPFHQAEAWSKAAVEGAVCANRGGSFFSSSKGWAMVREKIAPQYERLGHISMPPQAVKKLCETWGIQIKQTRPADSALLLKSDILHAAPDWQNDPFAQALLNRGASELPETNTNDSDAGCNFPPRNYFFRRLPPQLDEWFGWLMNPTG